MGDEVVIKWQAPSDMQSVTAYLIYSGLDGKEIGTYAASSNELGLQNGLGEARWTIPMQEWYVREGLQIRVNGNYNQRWIVSQPAGPFGIVRCEG